LFIGNEVKKGRASAQDVFYSGYADVIPSANLPENLSDRKTNVMRLRRNDGGVNMEKS
jgi:hypothetical protein